MNPKKDYKEVRPSLLREADREVVYAWVHRPSWPAKIGSDA